MTLRLVLALLLVPMAARAQAGALVQDTTKVLTFHLNPPATVPPRDSAWTAFTRKYESVSTILTQTFACLPKGM